jgi:hypothetical protein
MGDEQGVFLGVDNVVSDVAEVWDMGVGETSRFWVFWCELGGWDGLWGCFGGFMSVHHHFPAVARGPEWGRAGCSAIVDGHVIDDIACLVDACGVILGSWWITGAQRSSRGELGCLGGVLDRCWGLKGC